ncbi:outer membrane beta-barrel protein [Acidocella sp.]|uniref:outer membrane beta-barrel protein n=1 Tax=Acidocella sp. TaxID=50710 RepID=UPI003D0429B0
MFRRYSFVILLTMIVPPCARAQLLDDLLPSEVPGYAQAPTSWRMERRVAAQDATGLEYDGLAFAPALSLSGGYDSAPNGSAGSSLLDVAPRILVTDAAAGFGLYAGLDQTAYQWNSAQNQFNAAVAGGEQLRLPRETVTVSAAYLRAEETDFSLGAVGFSKPEPFTLKDVRVSNDIALGQLSITPRFSASFYNFQDLPWQDRTDLRAGLTLHYDNGAPLSYVAALRVGRGSGQILFQDACNYAILAGLQDKADGLWTLAILAGGAWRVPRQGPGLSAPVMEARLDWAPSRLEMLHLNLAREIDDPDRLGAMPYTLTQAKLTLLHGGVRGLSAVAKAEISNADYIYSPLNETLMSGIAELKWRMSPFLALEGRYRFNDRQSNQLGAANEHVITLGLDWTP